MNNKTSVFLAFVLGAAIGSFTTWRYVKGYYEQIAQEEIDSVKEVFSKRENAPTRSESRDENDRETTKEDLSEYNAILNREGYRQYFKDDSEKKGVKKVKHAPYVISPEEFGEFEEYDKISLTYYNDHVLADENDDVIEDVEEIVGIESLTHFGEYEDDSVFVRNDTLKCDYEILLDHRSYSDVISKKPHQMEEE